VEKSRLTEGSLPLTLHMDVLVQNSLQESGPWGWVPGISGSSWTGGLDFTSVFISGPWDVAQRFFILAGKQCLCASKLCLCMRHL
jgi:hypothetical protein